jgi:hypothetical protein
MGRDLSIEVVTSRVSFAEILDVLLAAEWEVRDVAGVSYLPLEATDVSDWNLFSDESAEVALAACRARDELGLPAAIVLLQKGTDCGGAFLWFDGRILSVSLNVNVFDDWDFNRWVAHIGQQLEVAIPVESFSIERR